MSASSILGEFTMRVREIQLFPYFMPLLKETWTLCEGKFFWINWKYFYYIDYCPPDPTDNSESKNFQEVVDQLVELASTTSFSSLLRSWKFRILLFWNWLLDLVSKIAFKSCSYGWLIQGPTLEFSQIRFLVNISILHNKLLKRIRHKAVD